MNVNSFTLSQDAYNAHMLGGVMDGTSQPGETAAAAQSRCAAIVEMFRTLDPGDAMESSVACHCITLRFLLDAAMRDANNVNQEPGLLLRMRASAMSISKMLHLWLAKFDSLHARNEARAAEARQRASQPAPPPRPEPDAPPASPERARPIAARAIPPPAVPARPTADLLPMQAPRPAGMKNALLSGAAMPANGSANGRASVPAAGPGRTPPPYHI